MAVRFPFKLLSKTARSPIEIINGQSVFKLFADISKPCRVDGGNVGIPTGIAIDLSLPDKKVYNTKYYGQIIPAPKFVEDNYQAVIRQDIIDTDNRDEILVYISYKSGYHYLSIDPQTHIANLIIHSIPSVELYQK